jgi:hypothetical protein
MLWENRTVAHELIRVVLEARATPCAGLARYG